MQIIFDIAVFSWVALKYILALLVFFFFFLLVKKKRFIFINYNIFLHNIIQYYIKYWCSHTISKYAYFTVSFYKNYKYYIKAWAHKYNKK